MGSRDAINAERSVVEPIDDLLRLTDEEFKVHTEAYTSQQVFELEMSRIFETTWVYVGHESEISHPGAYKTTHLGLQPVIVSRADEGAINVMVNRCRHRASVVCRERTGTAHLFRCPYHGWVYRNDGSLSGVSLRSGPSGYADTDDLPDGLFRLPRVETYRGLIFASFDPDVPGLEDFLGHAKVLIDNKLDESPVGRIRMRGKPFVARYEGNWKFQSENIVDGYHFTYVHEAFIKLQQRYGDSTGDFVAHEGRSGSEERKLRAQGFNRGTRQGHGLSARPVTDHAPFFDGPYGDYYRALCELRGEDRFSWLVGPGAGMIFPNFGFIHHQLRTWRPIAVDRTEVTVQLYDIEGAPDEINDAWMRSQERFYGPAGHGQPDDTEMFALNHQGLQGRAVEWLILERGLHTERLNEEGDHEGPSAGEINQRAFWRRWREAMHRG